MNKMTDVHINKISNILFGENWDYLHTLSNRLIRTGEKLIFKITADRLWGYGLKVNSTTLMDKLTGYHSGGLMFEVLVAICEELHK